MGFEGMDAERCRGSAKRMEEKQRCSYSRRISRREPKNVCSILKIMVFFIGVGD